MAELSKVRVQLLNETTGAVIEEVDVLTSASAVTFTDGQTFQQKLDNGTLKGATGDTGATGTKGVDGKTWHVSAVVPATSLGVIGDLHLNTATWDVREKTTATVWTVRGNIKGATGATGATGPTGPTGPPGADGASVKVGTTYETGTNVRLFLKKV